MSPEPRDYGSGHAQTPGQIDAFAVKDPQLLLDYHDAVLKEPKRISQHLQMQISTES
jgi:hypothetical protein